MEPQERDRRTPAPSTPVPGLPALALSGASGAPDPEVSTQAGLAGVMGRWRQSCVGWGRFPGLCQRSQCKFEI